MKIVGRYTVDSAFAAGGMASVHLGRVKGPLGFSRTVAVKRLLPDLASDPNVTALFIDEARLASRIRHVNVVPTLDVVAEQDDLLIVMEYVAGLSLSTVLAQPGVALGTVDGPRIPLPIVSAIMTDVLEGLHAAHTATTEVGERLSLVHRDVSPQNVLVGSDGIARVIDFGIATASDQLHHTDDRNVRGKIGYMSSEQLRGEKVTFSADVYGASVILWELLAHRRLVTSDVEQFIERVHLGDHDGPRKYSPTVPIALEEIVMQGLAASPSRRFPSAHDMAVALQSVCPRASALDVSAWLSDIARDELRRRAEDVARFESMPEGRLSQPRPSTLGHVAYDPATTTTERLPAPETGSTSGHQLAAAPNPGRQSRFAAMAIITLAAALVAFVMLRNRSTARGSAVASPIVASVSAIAVPAPPPATSDQPAAPPATLPARGRLVGAHHATKSAAPTPTTSTANCKVPFYFDADGTKHYRPECVR